MQKSARIAKNTNKSYGPRYAHSCRQHRCTEHWADTVVLFLVVVESDYFNCTKVYTKCSVVGYYP